MLEIASRRAGMLLFLGLAVVIYFPVFLHLDYMPFCMWDESVIGVNAIEMARNHHYLTPYFFGYPDMFRCKPPFMIWSVMLSAKILGFSEFSLRLPSALAAAALCVYLFLILKKISGNYLVGFFAVCVLVTCPGYIGLHVTRTGDYDSLWILFSTIFSLNLFMAVEAEEQKTQSRYLFLFFVFLMLGLLTKGVACMLQQLVGLGIYVLLRKKTKAFLSNRWFYAGLATFLVFGAGYYLLRESVNPGYIKAVWVNEIGSRFLGLGQGQDGSVTYYLKRMVTLQFAYYIFFFPVALYFGLRLSELRLNKIVWFCIICSISFFCLITIGAKKEPHYGAPLLPFLAIIMGSFFYEIYTLIKTPLTEKIPRLTASAVAFVCIISLLAKPYYEILKTVYFPVNNWEGRVSASGRFFQRVAHKQMNIAPYKLVYKTKSEYGPATMLSCYTSELAERGIKLWFAAPEELVVHDSVIVFDSISARQISRDYKTDTIQHLDYCDADIIYIEGVKNRHYQTL